MPRGSSSSPATTRWCSDAAARRAVAGRRSTIGDAVPRRTRPVGAPPSVRPGPAHRLRHPLAVRPGAMARWPTAVADGGYEAGYAAGRRDADAADGGCRARTGPPGSSGLSPPWAVRWMRPGRPTRSGRPSSSGPCPSSPSISSRRCSAGSRCWPSIRVAMRSPAPSPSTTARCRRPCGSIPTTPPPSGTWPISSPSRLLTVVADPTVEPGGALVEVGATTIDSQLSRALERVRAVIVGQTGGEER